MTNEEQDLLIAYLVDAGDIDPDSDVEAEFLEWCQARERGGVGRGPLQGHPRGRPDTEAELRPRLPSRLCRHVGGATPAGRRPGCLRPRHALRLLRRRARCRHGRGEPQTAASSPLADNVGRESPRRGSSCVPMMATRTSTGIGGNGGASFPPPQQEVRLAFFTGYGDFSRHSRCVMGMLTANHDSEVRPTNTVANFPSPVLVYPMSHRPIRDAERRLGISGLCYQVTAKVIIVVVIETYEHTFGSHS